MIFNKPFASMERNSNAALMIIRGGGESGGGGIDVSRRTLHKRQERIGNRLQNKRKAIERLASHVTIYENTRNRCEAKQ